MCTPTDHSERLAYEILVAEDVNVTLLVRMETYRVHFYTLENEDCQVHTEHFPAEKRYSTISLIQT